MDKCLKMASFNDEKALNKIKYWKKITKFNPRLAQIPVINPRYIWGSAMFNTPLPQTNPNFFLILNPTQSWIRCPLPTLPTHRFSSIINSSGPEFLKNSGLDIYYFDQKYDNGVNDGFSWFGINLIVSLQDITQNMIWILAKISHPAGLEIC